MVRKNTIRENLRGQFDELTSKLIDARNNKKRFRQLNRKRSALLRVIRRVQR